MKTLQKPSGTFLDLSGERWYRIENYGTMDPFFLALTGDSDLWAFVSTNGSLAAGRRDQEQSFFPYETVDKIHTRWETTGPRTWILTGSGDLWEPFARRPGADCGQLNIYKNITGSRILLENIHPKGNLCFRQEWSSAGSLGLVRQAQLLCLKTPEKVRVLDGLLNLLPAGVSNQTYNAFSSLTDAYKWNECHAGGRLGVYTMYAQLWDRAEPKESFQALAVWASVPAGQKFSTLLSSSQVEAFCRGEALEPETLTRGQRGAFLLEMSLTADRSPTLWYQVTDGPLSQVRTADLKARLEKGWGTSRDIEAALEENRKGLAELLTQADGFQSSGDEMAGVHHTANVLFNIMRGGVFPEGTRWEVQDFLRFVRVRNRALLPLAEKITAGLGETALREEVVSRAAGSDPHLERLVREYLPLTFSRRHGDPSRPWNKFSIKVRNDDGHRVMNYQGNWRDIFQNWEALLWSQPEYTDSMIATFLSAMSPDGYNPYRITRDGIDWETIEADDPWSFIGYWGDHQVIYLQKFLEAARMFRPGLLSDLWHHPSFTFADIPYRIRSYRDMVANPKATIDFDHHAHEKIMDRAGKTGGDGKLVQDSSGKPVMGTLGEKLVTILLTKAGNLVPGGGVWMNTQRPEWNDANNALVGNGLSLVTAAALRRMLAFVRDLPEAGEALDLPRETARALEKLSALAADTPVDSCSDPILRRRWMDQAQGILEEWRNRLYQGWETREMVTTPAGGVKTLAERLLPLIDATLLGNLRSDGLYHSYNLLTLTENRAEVSYLYPMLEGQVAMISSGLLDAGQVIGLVESMKASALYDPRRRSYMLYPDRGLPGFLEKNVLDRDALASPAVKKLLEEGRKDVLQTQEDGTVRFAPHLANRFDVEDALKDRGADAREVADVYERLLGHKAFTGRSGTMFGYEGLGCIYWHMVAKLLLAVQEAYFTARDQSYPGAGRLAQLYREVRKGLGYKKTPEDYGAFPFDPYSHTPGQGGAQQPGMTGQVKEEVLTRWGELGLRWMNGRLHVAPTLLDPEEIPAGGALEFTYRRIPFRYIRGSQNALRARTPSGWTDCPEGVLPDQFTEVEATLAL